MVYTGIHQLTGAYHRDYTMSSGNETRLIHGKDRFRKDIPVLFSRLAEQ